MGRAFNRLESGCPHAHGIAQRLRLGWYRPVHAKSASTPEVRALLTASKLIQAKARHRVRHARSAARVQLKGWSQPWSVRNAYP